MSRLFGPMRQVGIVVRDIDKAMRHWVEVCGVGPWFYAEQLPMDEFRYKGRRYDIKVSIRSLRIAITSSRSIVGSLRGRGPRHAAPFLSPTTARRDGSIRRGLCNPAGLPLAAAELAAVDDAGILVAGGAQCDGAGHRAILDRAFEAIGQIARLVAAAEAEPHPMGFERADDRPRELPRVLMPGQLVAALFKRETVAARPM